MTLSSRRPSGPGDSQFTETLRSRRPSAPATLRPSSVWAVTPGPSHCRHPALRAPDRDTGAGGSSRRDSGPAPLTIAVIVLHGAGDGLRPRTATDLPQPASCQTPVRHRPAPSRGAPPPRTAPALPSTRLRTRRPRHRPRHKVPPTIKARVRERPLGPVRLRASLVCVYASAHLGSTYDSAPSHALSFRYRPLTLRGAGQFRVSSFTSVRRPRAWFTSQGQRPATPLVKHAQGHGCHPKGRWPWLYPPRTPTCRGGNYLNSSVFVAYTSYRRQVAQDITSNFTTFVPSIRRLCCFLREDRLIPLCSCGQGLLLWR